jgi:hypothetical protein
MAHCTIDQTLGRQNAIWPNEGGPMSQHKLVNICIIFGGNDPGQNRKFFNHFVKKIFFWKHFGFNSCGRNFPELSGIYIGKMWARKRQWKWQSDQVALGSGWSSLGYFKGFADSH